MTDIIDHRRKVKRALQIAAIGAHPLSASTMLDAMPASALDALTGAQLAEMIDAMWAVAGASKALAESAAIENGFIWDARRGVSKDIAA